MPDINELKRLSQSLAMLDAIIEPDWQYRFYSFNAHWSQEATMASMRDGSGDSYFILFNDVGAIIKGFAHECAMSPYRVNPPTLWPEVMDAVPAEFSDFLRELAFVIADATFCLWRRHADSEWQRGAIDFPNGADPDGSAALLAILDGNPKTYQTWAQEYYERDLDLTSIAQIYRHQLLSQEIIESLNADLSLVDVMEDAAEIGYPTA